MNKPRHRRESCGAPSHPGYNSTIPGASNKSLLRRVAELRAADPAARQDKKLSWWRRIFNK